MAVSQLQNTGSRLTTIEGSHHDHYEMELSRLKSEAERKEAHFQMQLAQKEKEHTERFLKEVDQRVLEATHRIQEEQSRESTLKINTLEEQKEELESEKEKAWAAYTLLRKVVDRSEEAKAKEDSMALKEHQELARAKQEIEVMRQEVQRLQEKTMAAYEAKVST